MRLMSRIGLGFAARLGVLLFVVASVAASAVLASPAAAATGGLAYDEISKMVMGSETGGAPEPGTYVNGSFEADFQAAVNAGAPPKTHNGMFSSITNAMAQGQRAMNMLKVGMPSTYYFLNGWERTDDAAAQTATIYRPDLHQTIHLDLAKKTYYIETTDVKPMEEGPPAMPQGQPGPQPSPQPGTAKMVISASTAALGPKTIDNQPTNGYKQTFKMTVSEATGSCKNGSFGTSMTEFVSQYPEPTVAAAGGKPVPHKSMFENPQGMAVKQGCKPTVTANTKIGPTPPAGMLSLWMFMDMSGSMNAQEAQSSSHSAASAGTFGFLVERGNVRTLGPGDASLFSPPAGFTQTSAPGS